ncbi:MAG: ATP-binding protein [Thermoanaerobaculaceae bacterium]
MASDFEIGRVVAVDTAQVTVELNADIKALARATYEGTHEVGRINSYIILPVGARRLVAMVTRIVLAEEAEISADRTMVTLPAARRIMKATLIGTIDGRSYSQGVALFPVLDNPVHLVTGDDLSIIFDRRPPGANGDRQLSDSPGFCVHLGDSPIFQGYPIQIDPDAFFGKHAAILGSTGSGKSCTIASLVQSILAMDKVRQTQFVILDTNGEYRSAFQRETPGRGWADIGDRRCLYIPSGPGSTDRLTIPYWFMNTDDFVRIFRASANIQRPVLLDALRLARTPALPGGTQAQLRETVRAEMFRLLSLAEDKGKTSAEMEDLLKGLSQFLQSNAAEVEAALGEPPDGLVAELDGLATAARKYVGEPDNRRFSKPLPLDLQDRIRSAMIARTGSLSGDGCLTSSAGPSADCPVHFDKVAFQKSHLEKAMTRDEAGGSRARDYCATMLMRIYRLLEDRRFEFLFGPVGGEWPPATRSLAAFLRDIIGLAAGPPGLSSPQEVPEGDLPFYDRQRNGSSDHNIVIIDLSLLAAEVLENVTALIGRLILEFLQRLGEVGGEQARGSVPVVLVLEEAQNYIHDQRAADEVSISRVVFERIAREGRKFGLGLVVASQRPSELSKTVLSQCSSFVVHRLQNPEDLRYFKDIVPGIYGPLLDQLPALAPQTALVLGPCVRAPALVRIRECRPVPRSRDPRFYAYWVREHPPSADVEGVCATWEGQSQEPADESVDDG